MIFYLRMHAQPRGYIEGACLTTSATRGIACWDQAPRGERGGSAHVHSW